MSEHVQEARLNDHVEGLLPRAEARRVERHLDGCKACRERAERLGATLEALRSLPAEAAAPEGLWAGIRRRIAAEPRVVPFPGGSGAETGRGMGRRISLSLGQLLAAGIALATVSGGLVWYALGSGGEPVAPGVQEAFSGSLVIRTAAARGALADYEAASRDLEAVLREGRDHLRPETVVVLEENLRTVDEAIAEARAALARDPGSEVLYRLLAKNMRKKLELLRSAAQAVQAAS